MDKGYMCNRCGEEFEGIPNCEQCRSGIDVDDAICGFGGHYCGAECYVEDQAQYTTLENMGEEENE